MGATITIDENIELDNMTIEEVYNLVNKIISEKTEEKLLVSEKELQNQAKIFLSAILTLEREKNNYEELALKFIAFKGNPDSTEYEKNKMDTIEKSILQQEYLLANNFEKYLSNYRNELERSAIYVTTNTKGEIVGSYEIPMKELITYTDKLGYFSQGQINALNQKSLEEQNLFEEQHVLEAKMAYEGVYNRLERYYELHNTKDDTKTSGILLWKNSKGWQAGRVLNYGDLKEAYIGFLFDNHEKQLCKLAGGNPPYYNHTFIGKFFENYINQVTNLSAIVEEDIKVKSMNKQYAVKGLGSHLPSLQQYIDIAQSIAYLSKTNYITKKWVEKKIRELNPNDAKRNIKLALTKLTVDEFKQLKKDFNRS